MLSQVSFLVRIKFSKERLHQRQSHVETIECLVSLNEFLELLKCDFLKQFRGIIKALSQ